MSDRNEYHCEQLIPDIWDQIRFSQAKFVEENIYVAGKDMIKYLVDNKAKLSGMYLLGVNLTPFEWPKVVDYE